MTDRSTSPQAPGEGRPTLAQIYEAELDYVWRTLRRLGVPERDVPDVAHDLFVTVGRKLDDYDPARPLRPWLVAFAYRIASDYRRKASNAREELAEEELPVQVASDGGVVAKREAREMVMAALQAVPVERRVVFVLHEIDGHAIPEVAEALDIPLNTAYSRLRLARGDFEAAVRARMAQEVSV